MAASACMAMDVCACKHACMDQHMYTLQLRQLAVGNSLLHKYAGHPCATCRYVIPAFETRCGGPSYADSLATMIKQGLHEHIARDCLGAMRGKVAVACHGPTDFGRWFNTTQPYDIQYATHFEPWFLSHRLTTRWFDARYRGYGKNKIVQVSVILYMQRWHYVYHHVRYAGSKSVVTVLG